MRLGVPLQKDSKFAQTLFKAISDYVSDLAIENEKLPNKIIFMGSIGAEVLTYIREKDWNFRGFELEAIGGALNSIVFKYAAPLTQKENRGAIFSGEGLNNREISGIPGPETIGKIMGAYASPSFEIEKTVRPEKRILLIRG